MTPAQVRPVEPAEFDWGTATGVAARLRRVLATAAAADGADPLNEAALLRLRHRGLAGSELFVADVPDRDATAGAVGADRAAAGGTAAESGDPTAGFAWLHDGEVELVVAPAERGRGYGDMLADAVLAASAQPDRLTAWSHGDHPAAAAIGARVGMARVRELWVMRRLLGDLPEPPEPAGGGQADAVVVRPFVPGQDETAFLAVNAQAFAHHAEQGSLDADGLAERMAEPWFDPKGFLLAEAAGGGDLLGFHWTKVHDDDPPYGEVYVVGVSPRAQGSGLGRRLTLAGLHHLADRGLGQVVLYVEADNAAAVAVYRRLGFTHAETDTHVQYAVARHP